MPTANLQRARRGPSASTWKLAGSAARSWRSCKKRWPHACGTARMFWSAICRRPRRRGPTSIGIAAIDTTPGLNQPAGAHREDIAGSATGTRRRWAPVAAAVAIACLVFYRFRCSAFLRSRRRSSAESRCRGRCAPCVPRRLEIRTEHGRVATLASVQGLFQTAHYNGNDPLSAKSASRLARPPRTKRTKSSKSRATTGFGPAPRRVS